MSWGLVPGSNSALGVFFPTTMHRAQLEHWRQRAGLQSRELMQDSCESCSPERRRRANIPSKEPGKNKTIKKPTLARRCFTKYL